MPNKAMQRTRDKLGRCGPSQGREPLIASVRRPGDRLWRCVGNLHRLFVRVVLFLCVAAMGTTIARGTTDGHGKTRMEAC